MAKRIDTVEQLLAAFTENKDAILALVDRVKLINRRIRSFSVYAPFLIFQRWRLIRQINILLLERDDLSLIIPGQGA